MTINYNAIHLYASKYSNQNNYPWLTFINSSQQRPYNMCCERPSGYSNPPDHNIKHCCISHYATATIDHHKINS